MGSACLILAGILATESAPAEDLDPSAFRLEFRRTYDGLRKPVCVGFIEAGLGLIESNLFATEFAKSTQFGFLAALNRCAFDYGRREPAFKAADLWARIAPRERRAQFFRFGYGVEFGMPASTLEAFDFLVAMETRFMRGMPLLAAHNVMFAADLVDRSGVRKLAVLEALARIRYRPMAPDSDDPVRFAHARLLLARGDPDRALVLLEPVTAVRWIAQMRVDRLFEPLRADTAFAERLDLGAAMELDLARKRAAMDKNPGIITAVAQYVSALTTARRYEEAIALADAALGRYEEDGRAYRDGHVHRRLLRQARAAALAELGRPDEAVESLLQAANELEYRRPNVSQMLALGLYLVDLGRGGQALPLLPGITGTSRREQAWVEAIRSCAGAQLGRENERMHGLHYLAAHEQDEPAALSRALLCSNDLDGAAALMIRRLGAQGTSGAALMVLQLRPPLRSDELPFRKLLLERLAALRERPDVQEAVMRIGRIEELPVDVGVDF